MRSTPNALAPNDSAPWRLTRARSELCRRVLVLMSDTGGGHRSAAQALAEAFDREFPGRYKIELVDVIARAMTFPFNHMPEWYQPFIAHAEFLWRLLYHGTDRAAVVRQILVLADGLMRRRLVRLLREHPADLVVSVHPVLSASPQRALRTVGSRATFVVVVTDLFSAHGLWFNPDADLTVVATEGAQALGERWGVPRERLRVVGLPVSQAFESETASRPDTRAALGLDPTRTTALLVGGGEGMGRLYDIAREIDRARLPIQLVVIAGRNRRLYDRLAAAEWHIPVSLQRFVTNMPDWMHASDVIITKAGPGTISEALTCGLPILLFGFLPGQEEGNVTFVETIRAGVLREEPAELVRTLGTWLEPPGDTLARFARRARESARPRACIDIVHLLDEALTARELRI